MMKKQLLTFAILALMGFFASCSTKVDLYADYKDVPVIYGLIDVTQDTNYVKIIRAFSGSNDNLIDATQVALIADSSNYPGKLDACIYEYKNVYGNEYEPTGVVIVLDTITIHDKDSGDFYYPNQKVYYTTAAFNTNTNSAKYKYQLVVRKNNDTVTSETNLVGGENFKIITNSVTFTPDGNDKTRKINFLSADNAAVYEMKLTFNYKEKKSNGAVVDKQVSWSYGAMGIDDLLYEDNHYSFTYNEASLFNYLESAIGADTVNVERYIGSFDVFLSAGGTELYNYIQINSPSEGLSQSIPDYTNINGGYGVFSSRINLTKTVLLSARTQTEIYAKSWGFKQQ